MTWISSAGSRMTSGRFELVVELVVFMRGSSNARGTNSVQPWSVKTHELFT